MYSNLGTQVGAQNRDFGAVWDGWDSTSVKLCLVEQVSLLSPSSVHWTFTYQSKHGRSGKTRLSHQK